MSKKQPTIVLELTHFEACVLHEILRHVGGHSESRSAAAEVLEALEGVVKPSDDTIDAQGSVYVYGGRGEPTNPTN